MRQLRARHHGILQQVGRREPSHRAGRLLAALPQQRALGLVARHTDRERAVLATDGGRPLPLHLHLGARAVELDQQHGAGALRIAGARAGIDGADDGLVEHLHRGGRHSGRDRRRHDLGGLDHRAERGQHGLHRLRRVGEAHRDRRHQGKRALGADGHAGEVVAGAIQRLAADAHHLAAAGDQLQAQHVIRRDAVLQAMRTAGVGRYVAADGRHHLAGGIGREEPAALAHGVGEPQIDEPRLHGRAAIAVVDLEDGRHAVHRDHHAALRGHGAADEPGARAARHDGSVGLPARLNDRLHLLGARGEHHHVRRALVERVHVALVRHPPLDGHDDRVLPDDRPHLIDEPWSQRHGR